MRHLAILVTLATAVVLSFGADLGNPSALAILKRVPAAGPTEVDQVSGLFAWYKSDSLVTNTGDASPPSDLDQIKSWGDKSGNGRHLASIAGNAQWEAAIKGGLAGMEFGGSEGMRVGFSAQADTSIFMVWRLNSSGTFLIYQDATNASARQAVYKDNSDRFVMNAGSSATVTGAAPNTWYITCGVFNSGGSDSLYTNGVAASTSLTAGNQSLDGLTIGGAYDNTLNPGANHWIGEVVIYNRNLNSTEIGQVCTILNTRWAVY